MGSRLLWRRSATAAALYTSAALGILGTVVATRVLGLERFGLFATVMALAGFFQALLDLTVEESLTKYGFRYVEQGRWGRLRWLFRRALQLKLAGGLVAAAALLAVAPVADRLFGGSDLLWPMVVVAALPLAQAPENVAGTALLLRGRYDLRGAFLTVSMALRFAAIAVGAPYGVLPAVVAVVAAQVLATAAVGAAGIAAFRRFPVAAREPLGDDTADVVRFAVRSTLATGIVSLRSTLAPVVLGVVAGTTAVGLFRVAQAPQTGFYSLSSPIRLVLLTEQTRDWERGRPHTVLSGLRRYVVAAGAVMLVAVPVFVWLMPTLVELVFGADYLGAVDAARIVLLAAALQFVLGWTKTLPVSIGRPGLRIVTHGIEAAVLLPLVAVLGAAWGVTGAAVAVLVATCVFAAAWIVVFVRLHGEVGRMRPLPGPEEALAP
jgi:O-antigen/teichoic acid export membrane protein